MAQVSRQIGWSNESNLLYQILKQLTRLTSVVFGLKQAAEPKYKVFTALLTQSGGDNSQSIASGNVTVGVTYFIDGAGGGSDFSNVGGPAIGTNSQFFVATNSDVPNNYDGASLLYNTGAPVAIVLENTIGDIWFQYNADGIYRCISEAKFIVDKTTISIDTVGQNGNVPDVIIGNTTDNTEYKFTIKTDKLGLTNDLLYKNRLEIRVYN